jgi:hypothetical protein
LQKKKREKEKEKEKEKSSLLRMYRGISGLVELGRGDKED